MEYIFLLVAYFLGAIPFSLIIGKVFFKIDLRLEGSGNLGATNAFRVLGKKSGTAVAILDISKGYLAIYLGSIFSENIHVLLFGLLAILGHALSVFIKFKGGKSVATTLGVFLFYSPILILIALIVFFITLKIFKYVSLSSILAILSAFVFSFVFEDIITNFIIGFVFIFVTIKHKSNLIRIKNKNEPKVKWI